MRTFTDFDRVLVINAVSANLLDNTDFAYLTRPAKIHCAAVATLGTAGDRAELLFFIGERLVANLIAIPTKTTHPIIPDDYVFDAEGLPGERLSLKYKCGATARTVSTILRFIEF